MVETLPQPIERVLVPADELAATVRRLARELDAVLSGKEAVLIGALTGAVVFVCDLMRAMQTPVQVDFISVSSYLDQAASCGSLRWEKDLTLDIADREVVLADDIVDTGETLAQVQEHLAGLRPRKLWTAALLDKPARRTKPVTLDFVGLTIPDEFVVGYGLDYAQRYRDLPYIGVLRREIYG